MDQKGNAADELCTSYDELIRNGKKKAFNMKTDLMPGRAGEHGADDESLLAAPHQPLRRTQ